MASLNHLYGEFLLVFLWPNFLICLDHSPYLVYVMILPCVWMHLLAKMVLSNRRMGRASLDVTSALISSEPFCARGQEVSLTFRNEKYVVWAKSIVLLSCPAILVLEFGPYRMNLNCFTMCYRKEGHQHFCPKTTGWLGAGSFPMASSHRAGGHFGLPCCDSPASPLQQDSTDSFLGKWAPRVTVSMQMLIKLMLASRLNVSSVNTSPIADPEFMWKNTTWRWILRYMTLWGE